jgi:hypothetical protein
MTFPLRRFDDVSRRAEVLGVSAANIQDWLKQGESLYQAALKEFHDFETQLAELETRLAAKQAEVNQIAQMIGKPMVESSRAGIGAAATGVVGGGGQLATTSGGVEIIDAPSDRVPPAGSNASIARALTGKFGR